MLRHQMHVQCTAIDLLLSRPVEAPYFEMWLHAAFTCLHNASRVAQIENGQVYIYWPYSKDTSLKPLKGFLSLWMLESKGLSSSRGCLSSEGQSLQTPKGIILDPLTDNDPLGYKHSCRVLDSSAGGGASPARSNA